MQNIYERLFGNKGKEEPLVSYILDNIKQGASVTKDALKMQKGPIVIEKDQPAPEVKEEVTKEDADIEKNIRKGLKQYSKGGDLPIEEQIPLFVEIAKKYPIFQKYPYLLPQISILESSGGQNITRENNPLNWAARIQKQGLYQPQSWEQSIMDAATAIAGDRPAGPRQRQQTYYDKFRKTGDIADFANAWEPRGDKGRSYAHDLIMGMEQFK